MPKSRSSLFILFVLLIVSPISNAKEKSKDKGPRLEKASAPDCRALSVRMIALYSPTTDQKSLQTFTSALPLLEPIPEKSIAQIN